MKQKITLGISPCPNDTYIYENLIHGLADSPFDWEVYFADVQTLNEMVRREELDVAKVSCGVVPFVKNQYRVLSCGGAIGYSCGPLLLSSKSKNYSSQSPILLPGKDTTAALLFHFLARCEQLPIFAEEFIFFDQVYKKLVQKEAEQGVVIHEHRFTWQCDGLELVQDLGAYWENKTGIPVPLGCTVAKNHFSEDLILAIETEIRQSIDMARSRSQMVTPFIRQKAQIANDAVIESHIRTFVTDFSYEIGERGQKALETLFQLV